MPDDVDGRDLCLRSRRRILGGDSGPNFGDIVALPHLRELRDPGQLTAAPHPEGGFEVCAELPIPDPQ